MLLFGGARGAEKSERLIGWQREVHVFDWKKMAEDERPMQFVYEFGRSLTACFVLCSR